MNKGEFLGMTFDLLLLRNMYFSIKGVITNEGTNI